MESCVNAFQFSQELLDSVYVQAKDFALSNGLIVRTSEAPSDLSKVTHVSLTVFPSPVPTLRFEKAQNVQKHINTLIHLVAHDYEFLRSCLKSTIKSDPFTRRLWSLYEDIRTHGISQPLTLGLLRSDYMLDGGIPTDQVLEKGIFLKTESIHIKQVEINTIASSFGGLSSRLRPFHRHTLRLCGMNDSNAKMIPENRADEGLAEGFVYAWKQYGNKHAVILFVIQSEERNVYDQRWLEYAIYALEPTVQVIRRTIDQLGKTASLADDQRLMVGEDEVAIVYFRSLYSPNDFKSEADWKIRTVLEHSKAIKCPTVYYQLAGTKKVQQVLARPGVLENFITDPEIVSQIRDTFAGQYSLDEGGEGDANAAMAVAAPEKYVLKPQREGGGNNYFGEDVRNIIEQIHESDERSAYILMERIHPVPVKNFPLISGASTPKRALDMVSELGIFGIIIGTPDEIKLNTQKGHILRTKPYGTDEGGVNAGFAALDSPFLV